MRYILFLFMLPSILFADPPPLVLPNIDPPPTLTYGEQSQVTYNGSISLGLPPNWQNVNGVWMYTTQPFTSDPSITATFADTTPLGTDHNGLYIASAQKNLSNGLSVNYTYAASAAKPTSPQSFGTANPPIAITATYHANQSDEIDWNYTVSEGVSTLSSIKYLGSILSYKNGQPVSLTTYVSGQPTITPYNKLQGFWLDQVNANLALISQVATQLNSPTPTGSTLLPKVQIDTNKIIDTSIQPTQHPIPNAKSIPEYNKH